MSESDISSICCMPAVAFSAAWMALADVKPPSRDNSCAASWTRRPISESPQRRWWSRKESGAPTVKLCSQSETLASSTVRGFFVDAVDAALEDHAADDGLVGELGLVDDPVGGVCAR